MCAYEPYAYSHHEANHAHEGKAERKSQAYLPAFSEKRSATITSVFSLKIAPLRRRWLLLRAQALAPPREAPRRSAPRRSVLSKKAPAQVSPAQGGTIQGGSIQVNTAQVGFLQVGPAQVSLAQVSFREIGPT